MRSGISHLLLATILWGGLSGCSLLEPVVLPVPMDDGTLPTLAGGVELDAQRIPSYRDVQQELADYQLSATTQPLTAAECACLAASRCQLAAVMEKEAANTRRELGRHRRRGPSELLPGILLDRAAEERNNAAQQALVAYYQLADIHLQSVVLAESYQELDSVQQTVRGLIDAGIPLDTDTSDLDRRRTELDRQNVELDVNETRLTAHVKTLIDEDPYSPEAIETNCSVEPRAVGYSLPEAMEIARQNDFELKSINKMLHYGTTEDLDVARGLLQVASPLLGQAPVPLGFFAKLRLALGHDDNEAMELRVRKQQLRELYQVRQKQLDLEVANGVISVQQHLLEVGLAKDLFQSWDNRVQTLASQRELQRDGYQELVAGEDRAPEGQVGPAAQTHAARNRTREAARNHGAARPGMRSRGGGRRCGALGRGPRSLPEHGAATAPVGPASRAGPGSVDQVSSLAVGRT